MYDKFEAFQRLNKQDFGFMPSRYEIWQGGQMVENGKATNPIMANVTEIDGEEKVVLTFIDSNLNNQLAVQNVYDEFVTSSDRLQLVTVPNQTNAENSMAVQMFKMSIGNTRDFKNFDSNEPFCCNLFVLNGNIDKITFSFTNPEKLIEFYSDNLKDDLEAEDWDNINLSVEFESADHLRYENGNHVSGPHGGARRMVKIVTNKSEANVHIVTLYNLDGDHPVWQNNIQMAPKQMKIVEMNDDITVLSGFGNDPMGNSFSDYGLSIIYKDNVMDRCILHMNDRNVDIEYLKKNNP